MVEDLIKQVDIEKIAKNGDEIYQTIKNKYEPQQNGKFLAIDIDSKDLFFGNDTIEAMELARKAHPNKVFYVVKIGFDSVETLANYY